MEPYLGIAITTKNREKAFSMCHDKHLEFQPKNSRIFVVDDGSDYAYVDADYRYNESVGISTAKNRCLQLMYQAGCNEFWLFDDDAYPLCKDWHLPYSESGINHLCRTFYKPYLTDGNIQVFAAANGCAMYYSKSCIDIVGGFDTKFKNKFEHTELTRRIFNAGLTKFQCMDVINSSSLIYCLDQDNAVARSFTNREMQDNLKVGYEYFRSREDSSDYIEFRT